jgi:hypothetical protein
MTTIARLFGRATMAALAGIFAVALTIGGALAASEFEGTWNVKDSDGKPFTITLAGDNSAKGTREEGMTGTWKEEGDQAVISWDTGWTTVIKKDGDSFMKEAYDKGKQPGDDQPTNTSPAEKS